MSKAGVLWLACCVPPLLVLWWTLSGAAPIPEPWSWRLAWGEGPLPLTGDLLGGFEDRPRFVVFRLLYSALLWLPGSDFGRFTVVNAGLALAFVAALVMGMRHGAPEVSGAWRAAAALVISLLAFSPAYGANWLVGARFRVLLPAACFALSMLLLTGGEGRGRWRFWGALLLAQAALFTDHLGIVVWLALAPLVWAEARRRQRPSPGLVVAGWCLLGNLGTLLCFGVGPEATDVPGLVQRLGSEPLATLDLALRLVGQSVTPLGDEPMARWAGALLLSSLLVLAVVLWRKKATERWWFTSLVLGGLLAVGVLVHREPAIQNPATWCVQAGYLTLLLPASLIVGGVGRRNGSQHLVLVLVLNTVILWSWNRGWDDLPRLRAELQQYTARVAWSSLLDGGPANSLQPFYHPNEVRELRQAQRLRAIRWEDFTHVEDLSVAPPPGELPRAMMMAGGEIRLLSDPRSVEDEPLDLVLVSQQAVGAAEELYATAEPWNRDNPYTGLRAALPADDLSPPYTLRAYGYRAERRHLVLLSELRVLADADGREEEVHR